MTRLGDEAREIGKAVGHLRDLDVATNELIKREADTHPEEPNLSVLASALRRRADKVREQVRGILAGGRTQTMLIDLARFVEMRGWLVPEDFARTARLGTPLAQLAEDAFNKRWKKVGACARSLETLGVEERHELRKQLKKLRYAVDFLSPLFPERRVDPFLRRLRKLQDVLGEVNDAAAVRTIFDGATPGELSEPGTDRAIGWVLGASQTRAEIGWASVRAVWRKLEETKPFWK
jgi:CHAD domain-containing protein